MALLLGPSSTGLTCGLAASTRRPQTAFDEQLRHDKVHSSHAGFAGLAGLARSVGGRGHSLAILTIESRGVEASQL